MHLLRINIFFVAAFFTLSGIAEDNSYIDSPNGLFIVNRSGVDKILVDGAKDKYGDYKVKIFNIISIYSNVKFGELTGAGWWYPSLQQFNFRPYEKLLNSPQCNGLGKHHWSFRYSPVRVKVLGKYVNAYKEVNRYGKRSKPETICVNVHINRNTCKRLKCNKWKPDKPGNYIFKNKDDAIRYFKLISR